MTSPQDNQDRIEKGRVLHELAVKALQGDFPAKELAEERIKVCENCPDFRKMLRQCSVCNCFMDLKTKFVGTNCPLQYW